MIGNEIGKGDVKQARKIYKTLHIVTFSLLSFAACVLFATKEKIILSFTNDTSVLNLTLRIVWLNCLIVIPDSYKGMIRGTIKGLGLQENLVILNLSGHWCLNLTLMLLLGFYF